MGLLDGLLKSITRQAVSAAVDKGIDKAAEAIRNSNNTESRPQQTSTTQSVPTPTVNTAPAVGSMPGNSCEVTLEKEFIETPDTSSLKTKEVHFTTYTCLDDGSDKELDNCLMIEESYHEFNSGAGEIDYCASYVPNLPADAYGSYDENTPYIFIGTPDRKAEDLILNFEKTGAINTGCQLLKMNSEKYAYKISYSYPGSKTVAYCYKENPSDSFYKCVGITYPSNLLGNQKLYMQHLEVVKETLKIS